MEQMFHILQRLAKDHKDTVLVTVIESRGSAPRRAGARMIVTRGGRNAGTIGGGALEHSAVQRAMQVLEERKSGVGEYHLSLEKAAELGMVCGGSVLVHYQYLQWEDAKSSAEEKTGIRKRDRAGPGSSGGSGRNAKGMRKNRAARGDRECVRKEADPSGDRRAFVLF